MAMTGACDADMAILIGMGGALIPDPRKHRSPAPIVDWT